MSAEQPTPESRSSKEVFIEQAATKLFIEVWRAMQDGTIDSRDRIADAALALRDNLNPNWPNDPDWLPEPLAGERETGS